MFRTLCVNSLTCVERISPWENGPHESSTRLVSLSYPDASPWRRWKTIQVSYRQKKQQNNNKPSYPQFLSYSPFSQILTIMIKWQGLERLNLKAQVYFMWTFQRTSCHMYGTVNPRKCFNSDEKSPKHLGKP